SLGPGRQGKLPRRFPRAHSGTVWEREKGQKAQKAKPSALPGSRWPGWDSATAEEESDAVMRPHAAVPPELAPFPYAAVLYPRIAGGAIKRKCRTAVLRWRRESHPAPSSRFSWRVGHIRPAAFPQTDSRRPA